uniref:FMRFamide-like neuropeptide AF1 n=1 Tax=Ascaris suum TaxID=6253 RepID=FAF1_ASCSU|nr:RecName: Full=FMRFamide-like neuropeptide AF1 [Ascaris suum]
KNEFIRF